MTDTRDYHHHPSNVFTTNSIKLTSSASEQNACFAYVCLVKGIKPSGNFSPEFSNRVDASSSHKENEIAEDLPIQVERTKALHELAESYKKAERAEKTGKQPTITPTQYPTAAADEDKDEHENGESDFLPCANPNVLELTKMKWLTKGPEDGPDYSSASVSPNSSSSNCSQASEHEHKEKKGLEDKYLSTIIRLDKEYNMFGLSHIAIVGPTPSKAKRKDDEKAVFHQTAIVQLCCSQSCCRYKSNTDLPSSLKCGCRSSCIEPYCHPCDRPICCSRPCSRVSSTCSRRLCSACKFSSCPPYKYTKDCNCFGLQIKLNRKPVFEEPTIELTPRSSCILDIPLLARDCTHQPKCIPPSPGFPYLMPCYWPSRPSAPCSSPARCFHNPPCLAARKPTKVSVPIQYICPKQCVKCVNDTCLGINPDFKNAFESSFGGKEEAKKSKSPDPNAARKNKKRKKPRILDS